MCTPAELLISPAVPAKMTRKRCAEVLVTLCGHVPPHSVGTFIRKPCRCLQRLAAVLLCFVYSPCAPRSVACRFTELAQDVV